MISENVLAAIYRSVELYKIMDYRNLMYIFNYLSKRKLDEAIRTLAYKKQIIVRHYNNGESTYKIVAAKNTVLPRIYPDISVNGNHIKAYTNCITAYTKLSKMYHIKNVMVEDAPVAFKFTAVSNGISKTFVMTFVYNDGIDMIIRNLKEYISNTHNIVVVSDNKNVIANRNLIQEEVRNITCFAYVPNIKQVYFYN